MPIDRKKQRKLTPDQRRDEILNAALDVFSDKGFFGASTKGIAEWGGMSEAHIFRLFGNKEKLFRTVVEGALGVRRPLPELPHLIESRDDAGVFRAVARHIVAHALEDPRRVRLGLYLALEHGHVADTMYEPLIDGGVADVLDGYIMKRIEEGAFRGGDAKLASRVFISMLFVLAAGEALPLFGVPVGADVDTIVNATTDLFLKGLKT